MPRTLHRLLAGSAAALAALAGTALPASAAPTRDVSLDLILPDITIAADSAGKTGVVMAVVDVPAGTGGAPAPIRGILLSVDTAGVAALASVTPVRDTILSPDQSCRTAGTVLTCTLPGPFTFEDTGPVLLPLMALQVTAKPGVAAGATGTLALTAQAGDGPAAKARSTVRIGEGVDLAAVETKPTTAAAGTRTAVDQRVANVGQRPVNGTVLVTFGLPAELLDGAGFSNCTYGFLTVCTFTDPVAPGRTYALSEPIRLKIPADAAAGSSATSLSNWLTTDEWQEALAELPADGRDLLGKPGTGAATRLRAVGAGPARAPQVDVEPSNNAAVNQVIVGGGRKTDMAAVGATLTGAPGGRVPARVGFVNNGPGTLYQWHFDNVDPSTHVTVPAGLKAVEVDEACLPYSADEDEESSDDADVTGAAQYLCFPDSDSTKAGARELFDFTFALGAKAGNAVGSVAINQDDLPTADRIDRNARNDAAKIAVTVTGPAAAGGTGGGGLAVTGANTALVAGAGALLVLAGAIGVLLFRRRRVRFTA